MYGSVTCKADLEGVMPEVTLNITHASSGGQKYPLDNIMVHSCVQSADTDDIILGKYIFLLIILTDTFKWKIVFGYLKKNLQYIFSVKICMKLTSNTFWCEMWKSDEKNSFKSLEKETKVIIEKYLDI